MLDAYSIEGSQYRGFDSHLAPTFKNTNNIMRVYQITEVDTGKVLGTVKVKGHSIVDVVYAAADKFGSGNYSYYCLSPN